MHILLFCFSPPFCGLLAELSQDKVCHYYIFLKFFDVSQVCSPVVSFCLHFTYVWWNWKYPKRAPAYWEFPRTECWNCWCLPWRDFPFRGAACGSKWYMSRPCWTILDRYAQALKNIVMLIPYSIFDIGCRISSRSTSCKNDTIHRPNGLRWGIGQPNGHRESLPKDLQRATAGMNWDVPVAPYEKPNQWVLHWN